MTEKPLPDPAGAGTTPQPVDERAARTAHGALALWALLFAAPHLYWAFGGRGGLGTESGAAEAALETTWFSAYNGVVTVGSVLGALLCGWLALRPRTRLPGWRRVLQVTGVLLLIRGAIGLLSLLLLVPDGPMPPYLLIAVEPWFVLGGLLCGHAARTATPDRAGRRPRPATDADAD